MSNPADPRALVLDPRDPAHATLVELVAEIVASPRRAAFPLERYVAHLPGGLLQLKVAPEHLATEARRFLAAGVSRREFLRTGALVGAGALLLAREAQAQLVPVGFWKQKGGASLTGSLRLKAASSAYLTRTPTATGNTKTFTWSGWVKRGQPGVNGHLFNAYGSISNRFEISYYTTPGDVLNVGLNNGSWIVDLNSTASYRDGAAWHHVVVAVDTTQAVAANRVRAWVNGAAISFTGTTLATQNQATPVNTAVPHTLGRQDAGPGNYLDCYLADVNFVDGLALDPTSFGTTDAASGQWIPKEPAVADYGKNGFRLAFKDGTSVTTLGQDSAGVAGTHTAANHFTLSGCTTNDQVLDAPTNNFPTLNPIFASTSSGNRPRNGNLTSVPDGSTYNKTVATQHFPPTGKWYLEITASLLDLSGSGFQVFGIGEDTTAGLVTNSWAPNALIYYQAYSGSGQTNGFTRLDAGTQNSFSAFTGSSGDVVMLAYDAGTGSVWIGRNGTWQGNPAAGTGASKTFTNAGQPNFNVFAFHSSRGNQQGDLNFGQGGQGSLSYDAAAGGRFRFAPPSGFKALSTGNLPAPSIVKPGQHFAVNTYTGNGTAGAGPNLGFQPDFVWIKNRGSTMNHNLFDSLRGPTKRLCSNQSDSEATAADTLTAFTATGFNLGTDTATPNAVNGSGQSYVAYAWKGGTSAQAGSETFNAAAGFSVVSFVGNGVGRTVPHSLGAVPRLIFVKERSGPRNWFAWHAQMTGAQCIEGLNTTQGVTSQNAWNGTLPTATNFSLGPSSPGSNTNGANCIAYLWSEVAGFSRIGAYTGNGSADGPFVWCGFRPAFVLIRSLASARDWLMGDTKRFGNNLAGLNLMPNVGEPERGSGYNNVIDFVSNGFKLRSAVSPNYNGNGETYIFAAFAEAPFKYANAR